MTQDEILSKPAGVLIKTTLVDFPGKVASSYFLRGCNLRCPYCYNTELIKSELNPENHSIQKNPDFKSPVEVLEHLYKRKNVLEGFVISGGEPLLNPAAPLLIKEAKKMGYKIKLDTNGTLPLMLESLISNSDTRPDFIALDIKTSPEKYKARIPVITQFENADIKSLLEQSVKLIKTLGQKNYEVRTVLVPSLVEKDDIKNIAGLIPHDASWQFAQFRNENCLDPEFNKITPYTDGKLRELTEYARTFIPGASLR
ncbi:MAG: anaerobic ribonucleoside-triphosphate reductase activating protein [Treponema sp.]